MLIVENIKQQLAMEASVLFLNLQGVLKVCPLAFKGRCLYVWSSIIWELLLMINAVDAPTLTKRNKDKGQYDSSQTSL